MNMKKNLVQENLYSGNEQVLSFKNIIQESIYPQHQEYSSAAGMAIGLRAIEAYKKSGGDQEGIFDLMLFFVECGTQFTVDYGDIDEDFYILLEEVFEEALILLKNSSILFQVYRERLFRIQEESSMIGWGYGDQIEDILEENFPEMSEFLKKNKRISSIQTF